MQSFSFIPPSEKKIFEYFCWNFNISVIYVAKATNQIQWFGQSSYASKRTTQETFL